MPTLDLVPIKWMLSKYRVFHLKQTPLRTKRLNRWQYLITSAITHCYSWRTALNQYSSNFGCCGENLSPTSGEVRRPRTSREYLHLRGWKKKMQKERLHDLRSSPDIRMSKSGRTRLAGNVARTWWGLKNAQKIYCKPWRQEATCKWEDNIKMDFRGTG